MAEKLYLIDGTGLIYRAHYAFIKHPLINGRGENTSAIFGTINSFFKLLDTFSPQHVAISFDRREKTFRHKLSEDYKANRPPMPDELAEQLAPIHEFFRLAGVPEFSMAGYEADDVLATLAERFKGDYDVVIVTSDKDFAQLVDDRVTLYDPFKDRAMDADAVHEKYGLLPAQFIDYLALVGDVSDNIPGVRGIGPKGASALLGEFGSLEVIYQRLDDIASKNVRQKLEEGRDSAWQSRQLATIERQVGIDCPTSETLVFDQAKLADALDFIDRWELGRIRRKVLKLLEEKELDLPAHDAPDDAKFTAVLVDTQSAFEAMLLNLATANYVALDTETTSTDQLIAELVGISLCAADERAYYVSLGHTFGDNLDTATVLGGLRKALEGKTIIAHNIKYDWTVLRRAGWEISNPLFDTMIASYLLDPGRMQHGLDKCALVDLDHAMIPITSLIGKGKGQACFDSVPPLDAADYAAEDAWATWRLWQVYRRRLDELGLMPLFRDIEMPLSLVLARMEAAGVYVDTHTLNELSKRTRSRMNTLNRQICDIAGHEFNLNSTQQLGKVLFEELGIPSVKRTKTGFSTDNSVLEKLTPDHEIARLVIEYRQLAKLDGTYLTALPRLVSERDGRLHTSFNQVVTSTGRLSSSNPNLQNIPIRTELGKEVRRAFVPQQQGWLILAADYSQIELRLAAILAGDETLIQAFRNGDDIHTQTAARIFGKDAAAVTADDRRKAKVINFGILYGMGSQRLSRELEISRDEAKAFIANYFDKFPAIGAYIDEQVELAKKEGCVQTLFGRRLYLPAFQGSNKRAISEAERVAVNMPIQGGAADIIKRAMVAIDRKLRGRDDVVMMLQVHDELVFEVRRDSLKELRALIIDEMENALPAKYAGAVSLVVEAGSGDNWFEAH
ncbi:MAG: DNA polymerase I [Candidatus Cloacimonetes bacterium]|nr:DNA polymerase I [Candidatus Cloacimonadota bacterium]